MKTAAILLLKIVLVHAVCLGQSKVNFIKVKHLEEIKSDSKTMFIDFYADWCTPCKKMEQEAFTDSIVSTYYNTNFINYQVDIDSEVGKVLKQKYAITGFPTSLYLNKDGQVVARKVGYKDKYDFLKHGQSVPKKMIATSQELATTAEMYSFILRLDSAGLEDAALYNKFFNALADDQYKEDKYMDLLYSKVIYLDFENKGYKYVLNNTKAFYQDSSRVATYLLPAGMKGKHEVGWEIPQKVNYISFVSIPIDNAKKKAKEQKDSALFESCITAKESILKAVYGHVPNRISVMYGREYVTFYTKSVHDMSRAEDGILQLYGLLIENKTPEDVIKENERIKADVKEKLAKSSPNEKLTQKEESMLNDYLVRYKNDVAFLLESYQLVDPSSPNIKQIAKFSKGL